MNKLVKTCLSAIIFLSLYSCGTYQVSTRGGIKIDKVLTITSTGDTIAVPLKEFQRYNYNNVFDNYRFNYNWGMWGYPYYGWSSYYRPNTWYYRDWYYQPPIYYYNTPTPKVRSYSNGRRGSNNLSLNELSEKLKNKEIIINRGRNNNETNRSNTRIYLRPESDNNGRRSWSREDLSPKPVVPRFSNPVQPGQIRRGSKPPVPQQSRSGQSSGQQGRGSGSGPRN